MDAAELLSELRASGAETLAAMAAVPADALERPGYENGWYVRQIMAHVAAMEFSYRRLPDLARVPARNPQSVGGQPFDMDGYNARQVEKRRDATPAQLMDEFARGRGALIALAAALDLDLLATPIRSVGGSSGTLAEVMVQTAAGHVRQHTFDFVHAAGGHETSEPEICAAAVLLIAEEARAQLDGVSEVTWRTPDAGGWSPANICGHIAEMLPYWAEHARRALAEGMLVGRPLDAPERLGGPARFDRLSVAEGADSIAQAAGEAAWIIRALPVADWQTRLPHRDGGAVPLSEIVEGGGCVRHGREHLDQLTRALRAAG